MIPNNLVSLPLCPVKGVLVILPNKHDLYLSYDYKSNDYRTPFSRSFDMRFGSIWPIL